MAHEVVMPRLGWTMEVGRLVEWLKQDGEPVTAGEPLFTVESDKALTEVEAIDSGTLHIPAEAPKPGIELPVGALLAYLVPPGEAVPSAANNTPASMPSVDAVGGRDKPSFRSNGDADGATRRGDGKPAVSPRARRIASELGVDWTVLAGSGSSGRIVERDVRAVARQSRVSEPRATPAVRRLAAEQAVDLGRLAAGGPGGRVTRADVRAAAIADRSDSPAVAARSEPLGPVRRVVAARMAESARTVAPVTLTTEADATELVRLRRRIKDDYAADASPDPVPTVTDLLVRIVALALADHPDLNASLSDGGLVRHTAAHVGIAVDTERGLVVPVIRDAGGKSAGQIAVESAALIERARAGTATPDELRGGTFTITNLGMYEIDAFTPIVNLPECAILGLGRIVGRPVVIDEATDEVAVRKMMALSLTFDHRIVDGAPAARFLRSVKGLVERPYRWLLR